MPRKINAANSAPVAPKAPKRKVVQVAPLALPRTLSVECDSTHSLSLEEPTSREEVDKAHSSASSVENTASPWDEDALAARVEREKEAHSKSTRDKCMSVDEDKTDQRRRKLSETISDVTAEDDASSSHEMESNVGLEPKSPERVEAQVTHARTEDESPQEDEMRRSDEGAPNIVDDAQDLTNRPPSHDEDAKCESNPNSMDQSVSSGDMLSLEVTPERREDGLSARNRASSEDDIRGPNKSVSGPDRQPEERTKLSPSRRPAGPERPPKSPRKPARERNAETARHVHLGDATTKSGVLGKDRETCTVVSTIPKCERLDALKEHDVLPSTFTGAKRDVASADHHRRRLDERSQAMNAEDGDEECQRPNEESSSNVKSAKRSKVVRSQSKSDDFQMDSLKRQRRHLTSPPEDIVYALNLHLPEPTRNSVSSSLAGEEEQAGAANGTRDVDVDNGESCGGLVTAAKEVTPSETDILLQKVSDTLSSALPPTSPEPSQLEYTDRTSVQATSDAPDVSTKSQPASGSSKDQSNEVSRSSCMDFPAGTLSSSTPNMTSQQDTSDYVSAMGEDLSISDWEYQLPAPPSAFRDSQSPVFDDYDTVTLGSVEAFKDPLMIHPGPSDATDSCGKSNGSKKKRMPKSPLNDTDARKAVSAKTSSVSETEIEDDAKRAASKQSLAKPASTSVPSRSEITADPRKEMISELENKIESGILAQTIGKDSDRRGMDNVSAPKIAPVDNTLSNFTITTYTKQKSLDIFEELEESDDYARNSDERFIKTFATLSRSNAGASAARNPGWLTNGVSSHDNKTMAKSKGAEEPHASSIAERKTEPKIREQDEPSNNRWQALVANHEKASNVQRSKSYVSTTSCAKYQTEEAQAMSERKHEPRVDAPEAVTAMKKATSVSSLNIVDAPRTNEKFSQWRDNILKRQEESTKEKQLQSLQVLKSILPQLKNAQQAEENVSKEYNSASLIEKTKHEAGSNEHSNKTNVVSTRESRDTETSECKQSSREEGTRRYTYTGPPAISLGSWSERPSVNVQIKMDTDYKLGRSNTSGNKTVVNINGAKEETDSAHYTSNISGKHNVAKHEIKIDSKARDELSQRSLITHTTASGFKKPLSNRVLIDSTRADEDRPVVTAVELKKSFVEVREPSKNGEGEIDTTPVNFKELTKTFGQHVNFKPKPKRANVSRHSADCHGVQLEDTGVKQNGHAKFARANNENENLPHKGKVLTNGMQQNSRLRKFTSVVGVNGTGQNFGQQNETVVLKSSVNNSNAKISQPMPVVKGFKMPVNDAKTSNGQVNQNGLSTIDGARKNAQPPKPPTMPVITGVTLKSASARPKSMPVQVDPRDMLLESIRNFGREKLKSTTERF